jgi:uncharacterized protein (TIGR02145 family)
MKIYITLCLVILSIMNSGAQVVPQGFLVGPKRVPTINIGEQTWMLYNLDVVVYNNGDSIPNITTNSAWSTTSGGAYSDYNNTIQPFGYGKLYNWYAVNDSRGVCPIGFHVPTDAEWLKLANSMGGDARIGTSKSSEELRSVGAWANPINPVFTATNTLGFSALPAGLRSVEAVVDPVLGKFIALGTVTHFWTSTIYTSTTAIRYNIYYNSSETARQNDDRHNGASIRCIKN